MTRLAPAGCPSHEVTQSLSRRNLPWCPYSQGPMSKAPASHTTNTLKHTHSNPEIDIVNINYLLANRQLNAQHDLSTLHSNTLYQCPDRAFINLSQLVVLISNHSLSSCGLCSQAWSVTTIAFLKRQPPCSPAQFRVSARFWN